MAPNKAHGKNADVAEDMNQDGSNAKWQGHWQACKVLKEEKDEACTLQEQQQQKLVAETIRTNRPIALAKRKAKMLQNTLQSTVVMMQ